VSRAAVTVEQFWHRVPGGSATSVLHVLASVPEVNATAAAPDRVDVVGVAARHRHQPSAAALQLPVRVHHLPLPRRLLYEAWHGARRPRVQLATGPVDVVHATTAAIPPRSAPLVVTVHDLAFLRTPEHFTRNGNRFFRRGLELTRRWADVVLVPSTQTLDDCAAAGIGTDRLRLVPWGVRPASTTAQQSQAALDRHGIRRPYVLWCGTTEPRKNLPTLLAAFAQVAAAVPDLDLVLVGPPGWGDALGSGPRPPRERVHVLGYVDDPDLQGLYAGATAFCYPSLFEGFGMPVLEAMAHGVPVVTSTHSPMAELAGDAGLVVPATDVTALAQALVAACGSEHDRLAARAAGRAGGYRWQDAARATLQAYRDVSA